MFPVGQIGAIESVQEYKDRTAGEDQSRDKAAHPVQVLNWKIAPGCTQANNHRGTGFWKLRIVHSTLPWIYWKKTGAGSRSCLGQAGQSPRQAEDCASEWGITPGL